MNTEGVGKGRRGSEERRVERGGGEVRVLMVAAQSGDLRGGREAVDHLLGLPLLFQDEVLAQGEVVLRRQDIVQEVRLSEGSERAEEWTEARHSRDREKNGRGKEGEWRECPCIKLMHTMFLVLQRQYAPTLRASFTPCRMQVGVIRANERRRGGRRRDTGSSKSLLPTSMTSSSPSLIVVSARYTI